ncbi:histidine kinase, partial [Streptomyces sp. OfavH-34-F]|nr:histidine kinase [Streptomyces sp. OfavH-34-F]
SGPYAIGPDRHERADDEAPQAAADPAPEAAAVTDKGLPKRTPNIVRPAGAPAAERRGSVDREALRRRLDGFQQGAKEGRRDVEAELAGDTRTEQDEPAGRTEGRTGDTGESVEEARS